jgi:hypothetical protein
MSTVANQQKGADGARVRCATRSRRGFAPSSAPAALRSFSRPGEITTAGSFLPVARVFRAGFAESLTRLPVRPGRDGAWPIEGEPSGRRWTETLTLQSTALCREPPNNPRSRDRLGTTPCSPLCSRFQARSLFARSTPKCAPLPQTLSPATRNTPTPRSAKSSNDWRARDSRNTSARECGRLRGDDPRLVSAAEDRGEHDRTGSETGRWRRAGWSSAARGRSARSRAMGIGALAAGAFSCPRCSNRALLRLTGLHSPAFALLDGNGYHIDSEKASPPASGGPVHTTLPDEPDREAELVRRGIRRTRPNIRSHGTRAEIAGQFLLRRFSIPCARPIAAVSTGDGLLQATAGAMSTKGASAYLRCGSRVPGLGVAAPRIPVGEAAFGRPIRLGTSLAHRGVGFFCAPRRT